MRAIDSGAISGSAIDGGGMSASVFNSGEKWAGEARAGQFLRAGELALGSRWALARLQSAVRENRGLGARGERQRDCRSSSSACAA